MTGLCKLGSGGWRDGEAVGRGVEVGRVLLYTVREEERL